MYRDIVIVREGDGYRLLYGQLHLAAGLSRADAVEVDTDEDGTLRIVRAGGELLVEKGGSFLPLYRNQ